MPIELYLSVSWTKPFSPFAYLFEVFRSVNLYCEMRDSISVFRILLIIHIVNQPVKFLHSTIISTCVVSISNCVQQQFLIQIILL